MAADSASTYVLQARFTEHDSTGDVWAALNDPDKVVIVQTAPAVRATLGECFGMEIGTDVEGKMVTALKMLGFDKVFDTDFAADLTIMEEANEFLDRVKNGGKLRSSPPARGMDKVLRAYLSRYA